MRLEGPREELETRTAQGCGKKQKQVRRVTRGWKNCHGSVVVTGPDFPTH